MAKLFVRNFPWSTTETDLVVYFNDNGFPAVKAQIVIDAETKRSKGFGFVQLKDETQNDEAMATLNDSDFNGRKLGVQPAHPDKSRSTSSY